MAEIVAAQFWLLKKDLDALKAKTGESTTKEVLAAAVKAYLKTAG